MAWCCTFRTGAARAGTNADPAIAGVAWARGCAGIPTVAMIPKAVRGFRNTSVLPGPDSPNYGVGRVFTAAVVRKNRWLENSHAA